MAGDDDTLRALQQAIRGRAGAQVWSQGVELAREGAVAGESAGDDEIVLRVVAPGRPVPPTVVLYPGDREWDCDCGSRAPACAHVAAAIIAVVEARRAGDLLPRSTALRVAVEYRFRRDRAAGEPALALDRVLVGGEAEVPVTQTLALTGAGRPGGGAALGQADLAIDQLLGTRHRGRLPLDVLEKILPLLAGCDRVRLDGAPVRIAEDALSPVARIEDDPDSSGVLLHIEADPGTDEVLAAGVARCGDFIHLLAATELTGPRLEALPLRKLYPPPRLGELVQDVLPALRARTQLDLVSARLPGISPSLRPRIHLELSQRDDALEVLPLLVYGDPPVARIDAGRLVHLGGPLPRRDLTAEQRLVHRLRDQFDLAPGRRARFTPLDAARLLSRLGGHHLPSQPLEPVVDLRANDRTRETGLQVHFQAGGKQADPGQVIAAWRAGVDLVPLVGGGFARLPLDWLQRHGHLVAELLAARDAAGRVAPHARPSLLRLCADLDRPPPPELAGLAPLVEGFERIPAAALPGDLRAELRPYQRRGVDWLCFLRDAGLGAILADDMGLGKTVQVLAALRGRALVVCPTSVVHNWRAEIERFRPGLAVAVYHGAGRALDHHAAITLTTWAILRRDVEQLAAVTWDVVVLDEAQAMKNPDSQVAQAAFRLRARVRVAVTGTPVENRLDELWSLMHAVNPGLLGGLTDFRDRLARPIDAGDQGAAERLRERIRPFVLRRRKAEVAPELPPRTEQVLWVELDDRERNLYDAVRAAAQPEVAAALASGKMLAALEALLRLRQAACHPALLPGETADRSTKVERLVDALDEAAADGHRALVFSQWTSALDLIEPHLRAAGLTFVRLDGSTSDRAGVVAQFQDPAGPPVMLISLKAGGVGLNLTAADHVFLFDPWWNPAVEDQAADRAHRIGQDRPVLIHRLVAAATVEERVLALQERKRALFDAALGDAAAATSITADDLRALLS